MIISFHTPRGMLVRTEDGRNCVGEEEIRFRGDDGSEWRGRVGWTTDWASTPAVAWVVGLPPTGTYARAAAIHDMAYRGWLERQLQDGSWAPAFPGNDEATRKRCDDLLLDLMVCDGVDATQRDIIYGAVREFGWKAFRTDRVAVTS